MYSRNHFIAIKIVAISKWFKRWILTAAHCVEERLPNTAQFGIDVKGQFVAEQILPPTNRFIYPGYNSTSVLVGTFSHDISD